MRVHYAALLVPALAIPALFAACSEDRANGPAPTPEPEAPVPNTRPQEQTVQEAPAPSESALDSNQWNTAVGLGGGAGGKFGGRGGSRMRSAPSVESYAEITESGFLASAATQLSTFAADVDTASYSNVRRILNEGRLPEPDAVRVEEIVNAFRYGDPEPEGNEPFGVATQVGPCPWNPEHRLLRVGLKTRSIETDKVPPCNLVFLLDVSGSMQSGDKLPLVKRAMNLLVDQLRPQDRVAIVTYARGVKVPLAGVTGDEKDKIREVISRQQAGGSTAGEGGIQKAYEIALQQKTPGVNRVILCTDGDFNVGIREPQELEEFIAAKKDDGIFLTVLGVGGGNLKDDRLESLADKGNGVYAYLDDLAEARRVLVEQFGATMMTMAKDVKLQVEFDPLHVAAYRLVGYENRTLAAEDFRDDKKDGGEMGAGHAVTALYEIVPPGVAVPGLELAPPGGEPHPDEPLGVLRVRYKPPEGDESRERTWPIRRGGEASPDLRLTTAAACFGMLLRASDHVGAYGWPQLLAWMAEHGPESDRDQWETLEALANKAAELKGSG